MNWTSEQIPNISKVDKYSYPDIDPRILLCMEPSAFNQWRREFDFPRIVSYLQENLYLFKTWQQEENILDEELIFFGPARFIGKNKGPIYITESDLDIQEDKKRIYLDSKKLQIFKSKPEFYGKVNVLKSFKSYLDWLIHRKEKPKHLSEISIFGNSSKSTRGNTSEFKINNELRLLNIGSIFEKTQIVINSPLMMFSRGGFNGESKNLEFLNFDFAIFKNSFFSGDCYLFFCSFSNVSIINTTVSGLHFYNSNLEGLKIEDSKLFNCHFENSNIRSLVQNPEYIDKSEVIGCSFINCEFFRFYNSIKFKNSDFIYTVRASENYANIKNIYNSSGDYYNSGNYYYLERKSRLLEKTRIIHYLKEDREGLNEPTLINETIRYFTFQKNRKKTNLIKKSIHYVLFFFLVLGHYFILTKDIINFAIRGFGEKPFRILLSFIPLIFIFSFLNYLTQDTLTFNQILLENSFNFFGKFEIDPENKFNSALRVFKAALGIFLISLFVADLSSKKRY
ncbi:hypothetical protein [Aquiflexum sp.]|uniref:hypothetical protein n=1 Tax=Aquiflexum sp. TaxID=1872584 RepID=UPI003593C4A6